MRRSVLFIIDSLNCGGAEKSLLSLLPLLDYSRFDVYLSVVRRGGVLESLIPSGVTLIPFPEPSRLSSFLMSLTFSIARRALPLIGLHRHGAEHLWVCTRRLIPSFERSFDIAVAYQQGFPTYYVAEKLVAGRKIAWVNSDLAKAGYRPSFNRRFYDKMSRVCAVSDALHDILIKDGFVSEEKLCVVKDILNTGLIKELATSDVNIDSFWENNSGIRILTVGRMAPPKNHVLAVETARLLKEKGLDFIWVFVGDGPERARIMNMVERYGLQKEVVFAGLQTNPYPFFASCDIYVQTSSFEGFGLTVSEAKLFHKPIVTTDFPSAHDQIADGVNGLVSPLSPEAVARRIMLIVENPSLCKRLVEGTERDENLTIVSESRKVNDMLSEN